MTSYTEYRFDFESFLQEHGVEADATSTGELRGACPFCWSQSRSPFSVNADSGLWICHHCDERGNAIALVMRLARCSYKEAKTLLEADSHDFYSRENWELVEEETVRRAYVGLPDEFRLLEGDDTPTAGQSRAYALSRGVTEELIARYGIGYCDSGEFRQRLVVPVRDDTEVAYFVARDITGRAALKVRYPTGAAKNEHLFNLDNVRGRHDVVVVEGVFDALMLPEMAVATCGKTMSDAQAALLLRAGVRRLLFAYDADAVQSSKAMAERFSLSFDTTVLALPAGEDPSSLGHESMLELLEMRAGRDSVQSP